MNDQEWRRLLNRFLVALYAQEPGSPAWFFAEEALIQAIVSTPWFAEADVWRIVDYLTPRWRRTEVYDLHRGFLRGIHRRLDKEFLPMPAFVADLAQLPPEEMVVYEDFADWFRRDRGSEGGEIHLFDFWLVDPYHGWQSRYSEQAGQSNATTSRQLNRLRLTLTDALFGQAFDCDAEGFIWRLHFLRAGRSAREAAAEAPEAASFPQPPARAEDGEAAALVCRCLREEFALNTPWQAVLLRLEEAPSVEAFSGVVRECAAQLDTMHCRLLALQESTLARLVDAVRFFHRLKDKRENLSGALAATNRPPGEHAMARRVVELAQRNPPVPFDELEEHLKCTRDDVVHVLNQFLDVCRQRRRQSPGTP